MYHSMEEQLARATHLERTNTLERQHRQKLAMSLRPTAQCQHRA